MIKLNTLNCIMLVLLAIGGLNWGLIGVANFDLVAFLFGQLTLISRIVYVLVGISAIYVLYLVVVGLNE